VHGQGWRPDEKVDLFMNYYPGSLRILVKEERIFQGEAHHPPVMPKLSY
jgi:hypothetical protein